MSVSQTPSPIESSPSPVLSDDGKNDEAVAQSEVRRPDARSIDELLLFQPSKYPDGNWEPQHLDYLDVFFDSKDGTRIHSWYCPAKTPKAVLLFLHGNAGNLSGRSWLMKKFQEEHQVSVMIVDYRGYGRSKGKATAQGAIEDVQAARKELAKLAKVNELEIVLMGRSLGGAIAIQVATEKAPRGLIIESSFTSLNKIAKHHFPRLAWLVPKEKLNSETTLSKYHGPLLISHGNRDSVIPFAMGKALFAAANEPKLSVVIPGANHNDPQTREYYETFDKFLGTLPKSSR